MPTAKNTELQRALEDFKRSGLSQLDLKKLQITPLNPTRTSEVLDNPKFKVSSYQIPYFDTAGNQIDFYRVRFLDEVFKPKSKKLLRYIQPPNSDPKIYLAPYIDWEKVFADPSKNLIITEGEKKAAKTCKEGFNCIGLGGIWNFRSAKMNRDLIDDLAEIDWTERNVLIIFDSDPKPKPEIEGAAETLGRTLEARGAVVGRVILPLINGHKVGLDDYFLTNSAAQLRALPVGQLHSSATLSSFNDEVAVIMDPPGIIEVRSRRMHRSPESLVNVIYADRKMTKINGAGSLTTVNAFREWMEWPKRRTHSQVVYEPGEPPTNEKSNTLNLWRGWGVDPKKGPVDNLHELLEYMFNGEKASREWFLQWLAYPLQHPGVKLYTSSVLWSRDTGTGKTLIGMTMSRIYGDDNFSLIGENELHASFNDWQANKQFILGEEVTGSDRVSEADRLKKIITSETTRINRKFEMPYATRDCANFLFTTNRPDAFLIDDTDRRFFIHEVGVGQKTPSQKFFDTYDRWYRTKEGIGAIFHHLLHKVDTSDFNPRGRAPGTRSKDEMVALSGNEHDHLVRDIIASPDTYLKIGSTPIKRDLLTFREILEMADNTHKLSISGISRAFGRLGIKSMVIKVGQGNVRIVPIRNVNKWMNASHADRVAEYTNLPAPKEQKF